MAMKTYSPLRYPGGKKKLTLYVKKLINIKKLNKSIYIEPFCGGAAVALSLLLDGCVAEIIINDYDKSIYAFWYSVLNHADELCRMINKTEISMEEWYRQKLIQENKENETLINLGFSTLFLNRTNRAGIIKAGVIGGKNQDGKYKLDCRFNKDDIIMKIQRIASYKDKIQLYNLDTEDLIEKIINKLPKKSFIFFDPPYYIKGASLYTNFYSKEDHISLSKKIKNIKYHSWILTYDNTNEIKSLYKQYYNEQYKLNYSVGKKHKGSELIFYSNTLTKVLKCGQASIFEYCER